MGDLGRPGGPPGVVGALGVRAGRSGSRTTFALEAHYQRIPLDSLYIPAVSEPGVPNTGAQRIPASTWQAWGVIARLDFRIVGGLYAIAGTGLLWREQAFAPAEVAVAPFESTDPVAQAGFGYRFGEHFVLEARFVNVFSVNDSERILPVTLGVRF